MPSGPSPDPLGPEPPPSVERGELLPEPEDEPRPDRGESDDPPPRLDSGGSDEPPPGLDCGESPEPGPEPGPSKGDEPDAPPCNPERRPARRPEGIGREPPPRLPLPPVLLPRPPPVVGKPVGSPPVDPPVGIEPPVGVRSLDMVRAYRTYRLTWWADARRDALPTGTASRQAKGQIATTERSCARSAGIAKSAKLTLLVVDRRGGGEDGRAEDGCLVHHCLHVCVDCSCRERLFLCNMKSAGRSAQRYLETRG